VVCFLCSLLPPTSTSFPYTTLFRSRGGSVRVEKRIPAMGLDQPELVRRGPPGEEPPKIDDQLTGDGRDRLLAGGASLCADQNRRSEEHTSELQSREKLVCRLLLEKT